MKRVKNIVVLAAFFSAFLCNAGDSAPFVLDTTTPSTSPIVNSLSVSWDAGWIGNDSSATIVISHNGTEIKRTTGEGEFTWSPTTSGKHTLTYTTYIDGVAQDEVYEAVVYADWKYTVEDGKATIVETTETSGNVTIPSEIDGYPIVEIGEGAFNGCTSLASVEIPDGVEIIEANAFCECESLETAFIPMTVTNLSANTFKSCSSLKQVDLPILFMGKMNFDGCPSDLVARYHCVVRLDPVDGTLKDDDLMLDVVYGDIYGELPIPGGARTGYHFGCWTVNGVDVYSNSVVNTASNHTLVAKWTANEYKVFLDATGGVIDGDSVKDVVYDGAYGELPVPSREGYVFVGWTLNGAAIDDTTVVKTAGDHTLVATWGIQIGNGVWSATICDDAIVLDEPLIAPTGDVTIPAEIAGRPVVGITADAFAGNGGITGVVIPESVTDIEDGAFEGCSGITSVYVSHVSDDSEWMAKNFPDSYANITNVVLGGDIGLVGSRFFSGCEALAAVTLPAGLTNIARTAFTGCSNVAEVTWCSTNLWPKDFVMARPINVVKIHRNGWGRFVDENDNPINNSYISPRISHSESTEMWADVYFEEGGTYTFSWYVRSEETCDCLNLYVDGGYVEDISGFYNTREEYTVELTPGEHVLTWRYEKDGSESEYSDRGYVYADEINEYDDRVMVFGELFADSKESLKKLNFAEGVVALPDGCLTGLEAVESVRLPSTLERFGDNDLRQLATVEDGLWIEQGWVLGYMGSASGTVTIPDGVKGIGSYAFEGQSLLDHVVFPSSLRYVGVHAFKTCTNLEEIELPEGVVRLEEGAFHSCTYAQDVALPSTLREIGDRAFANCTSFSGVDCPEAVVSIGEEAFTNCWRMLSVSLPVGLESVGSNAFLDCRRVIGVSVPTHLKTMAELFPSAYMNLTTVEIAEGEDSLVPGIFAGCASLDDLVVPDAIREIPEEAFVGCSSLQTFTLPDTVTNIGVRAFSGLTQLTSFVFPAETQMIADEAFAGCVNIAALSLPQGVMRIGAGAFADLGLLARVDIPGTVTEMGEAPFRGCGQVRAVTLPGDVSKVQDLFPDAYGEIVSAAVTVGTTVVGERLFADCAKLTAVDLPSTLTEIGPCAFMNCALLADVGIPAGVTTLGENAFLNCAALTKIALPNGLTTLPRQAFAGCAALGEIVIPENVTSLGDDVFYGCSRLSKVYFVGNAPSYTAYTYEGASADLVTYVENGSTGWDGIETSKTLPEFWPEGTSYPITTWTPNRFEVTFDLNYAGTEALKVDQVTGTTYILPADPVRQGAVFEGWWTSSDGGARVSAVTSVDLTRPHAFYAKWTFNTYSVAFDSNGGDGEMAAQDMTVETATALNPCAFGRAGYAFTGWATEPDGAVVYADEEEVVNLAYDNRAVVTLYAVWTEREWTFADAVNATESGLSFEGADGDDASWMIDYETSHDGVASLRSGAIGASAAYPDRTASTVKTTVVGAGAGSFWWKVHCEEMDAEYGEWYDYAVFTVDGQEVAKIAGDSGWQKVEYTVTGSGEHTLAWIFTRDNYDEEGAEWENAAWLDEVSWTPNPVTATFATGGASGEPPDEIVRYEGFKITLPGTGTLQNGALSFVGWSDGDTVYPAGTVYTLGSEDVTFTAVWELKVWTFGEAIDAEGMTFETGGDTQWFVDTTMGYTNAVSAKSGAVTSGQSSWLQTTVTGAGTLTFRWKVLGGIYRNNPFAYAKAELDGAECASAYLESDWAEVTVAVEGSGAHVIRWTYLRTSARDVEEGDCAWVDAVTWTPATIADPIPELPSTATAEEVAAALGGSADAKLAANITDAANYAAYREWALGVKTADGSAVAGAEAVKNAPNAWLSYALDTETLIVNAPVDGDVTIDTFEDAATDGAFDFTVNVKDIAVGDGALEENIRKVFDIEGVEDLGTGTFSADAVDVNAAAAEGGKVKFTVTPKTDSEGVLPDKFFFKVRMK